MSKNKIKKQKNLLKDLKVKVAETIKKIKEVDAKATQYQEALKKLVRAKIALVAKHNTLKDLEIEYTPKPDGKE